MKQHMYKIHEPEKHHKCPHCDYKSPEEKYLHVHIDKNHPYHDERKFFCENCGTSFIFESSLNYHVKRTCKKSILPEMTKARVREKRKEWIKAKVGCCFRE